MAVLRCPVKRPETLGGESPGGDRWWGGVCAGGGEGVGKRDFEMVCFQFFNAAVEEIVFCDVQKPFYIEIIIYIYRILINFTFTVGICLSCGLVFKMRKIDFLR